MLHVGTCLLIKAHRMDYRVAPVHLRRQEGEPARQHRHLQHQEVRHLHRGANSIGVSWPNFRQTSESEIIQCHQLPLIGVDGDQALYIQICTCRASQLKCLCEESAMPGFNIKIPLFQQLQMLLPMSGARWRDRQRSLTETFY